MSAQYDNLPLSFAAGDLIGYIDSIRKRGRIVAFLGGIGWLASGLTFLLFALIFSLGWWGGEGHLRPLGWLGVVAGALVLFAICLYRPITALAGREGVARRIGRMHPEWASDLLSATQLAGALADRTKPMHFSHILVERLLRSVREMLLAVSPRQVFPLRPLLGPLLGVVAAIGAVFACCVSMPIVIEDGLGALWSDPELPKAAARKVSTRSPVVGDLTLTLRYPDYLHKPERRLSSISGGLAAPLGTTVVVEGKSLVGGADRGEVRLSDESRHLLRVNAKREVSGSFVITASGPFWLALGNEAVMTEGPEWYIEVQQDPPPSIRLLKPFGRIELDESEELVIDFEAEDDHGLSKIDLVLRNESSLEVRKTIAHFAEPLAELRTSYRWSPDYYAIDRDGEMQIELEVFDDDVVSGPKSGRSEALTVLVMTPSSRHHRAIEEQTKALDALVDLLGKRLEMPPPGNHRTEEVEARFSSVRLETEDVLGRLARLIHGLRQDRLTRQRVVDLFAEVRDDLANQLIYEARLHEGGDSSFRKRQDVDRVAAKLLENAIIRIDDFIIDQQFSKLVGTSESLQQHRSMVADLLEKFDRNRTEFARRALMDAIANMEKAIEQLWREVESIRGKVTDAYINPSGTLKIDLAGILDRVRALVAAGDLSAAAEMIAKLDGEIGRMMTGLESGLLSFRAERFSEGDRFLGDLLNRVMEIESEQLQLRRETTALKNRYQERLIEVMRDRIEPLTKRQIRRVAEMKQALNAADQIGGGRADQLFLRLKAALKELDFALGQGELDESRQIANEVASISMSGNENQGKEFRKSMSEIESRARLIGSEIDEAYPRAGQLLPDRDSRLALVQAEKQRLLMANTRKLRRWIEEREEETRFLSHQARGSLGIVAGRMSEAVSYLENKQIGQAQAAQYEVLDELARLREDLNRGEEVTPLESRPMVLQDEIEIPKPDDYKVPKEYREDILNAMRSDLPDRYQEAIKRYYEMLVR